MAASILPFQAFQSSLDPSFWSALTDLKINVLQLSDEAVPIAGSYTAGQTVLNRETGQHVSLGCYATFQGSSLQSNPTLPAQSIPLHGTLRNFNTIEDFRSFDKQSRLKQASSDLWNSLSRSDVTAQDLNPFFLLTFADLKKYKYYYWFCFPAFVASPAWQISQPFQPLQAVYTQATVAALPAAYQAFAQNPKEAAAALVYLEGDKPTLAPLSAFKADAQPPTLLFCDPSSLPNAAGWPLRNILAYLAARFGVKELRVICWRGEQSSLVVSIKTTASFDGQPQTVGWEKNAAGKLAPSLADLSPMLDPTKLADQAVDLNLKLMRWRILPTLNLEQIKATRCLLLGAGTLGCYVARTLMAWGVRSITLVDSSTVSYSNPVRQPLFEFEDCLNGGKPKAEAAAASLKRVYPNVDAKGVQLSIPMPGHPIPPASQASVKRDLATLESLIDDHDVVYLLMDSRESRWLPTLIGRAKEKLVMNAALGFDSFLVMRHGLPLKDAAPPSGGLLDIQQLGCYYCSDITAARDSLTDRTLDQMCTVTRPGLASIASATAVELMVSVLQHPLGPRAPSDAPIDSSQPDKAQAADEASSPLGLVPHQIRGFLAQFRNLTLTGQAYNKCTGCSPSVLDAYAKDGFEFLQKACADASYLEQVTGLDKLAAEMEEQLASADWAEGGEGSDDDF